MFCSSVDAPVRALTSFSNVHVPGSSAVVCAPTSSGKTFISSYVIQQVLKPPVNAGATHKAKGASNSSSGPGSVSDGVVVIVLPTKALVNQLAAQVKL